MDLMTQFGSWCAQVAACSSGIFIQFGYFGGDPTKECLYLPAQHLGAAPCQASWVKMMNCF